MAYSWMFGIQYVQYIAPLCVKLCTVLKTNTKYAAWLLRSRECRRAYMIKTAYIVRQPFLWLITARKRSLQIRSCGNEPSLGLYFQHQSAAFLVLWNAVMVCVRAWIRETTGWRSYNTTFIHFRYISGVGGHSRSDEKYRKS